MVERLYGFLEGERFDDRFDAVLTRERNGLGAVVYVADELTSNDQPLHAQHCCTIVR